MKTSTTTEVCRFVRDTDARDHTLPLLRERFPLGEVNAAERGGYIALQRWGITTFVDLTVDGEAMLLRRA